MLKAGDIAPGFDLEDQSGARVTLDQLVEGGTVILYFYPVDFSPVCSSQARAFRDSYAEAASLRVQIVGVSPQGKESHARFAQALSIPFPLLSDPGKRTIRAYGVDGAFGWGVRRATFLIDPTKVIRNRVVSDLLVATHIDLLRATLAIPPAPDQ